MPDKLSQQPSGGNKRFAQRVTLAYGIVGSLWIFAFDVVLPIFFAGGPYKVVWEFAEGWIYVSTTSCLLYLLVKRHLATLDKVNEQLQHKERYLAKVLETLPAGVWLVDANGAIVQANPAAHALWRGSQTTVDDTDRGYCGWWPDGSEVSASEWTAERSLRSGETILNESIEIACFDGSRKTVLHSSAALRDGDNRIVGAVVVNQDITAIKNIEQELRENQRQLTLLAAELSMAEERERRRIATELHDQIGQSLALCKIRLDQLPIPAAAGASALAKIKELINATIYQVRTLTFEVSPPLLYQVGLEAALEWLGERFHEQYDFYFRFHPEKKIRPLSEEIRVTVFQVVRELLMNIAKHARATSVELTVGEEGGNLRVTLSDDGIGFDADGNLPPRNQMAGFGLFNARRRIEQLGGILNVHSRPEQGTSILICLPLPGEPAVREG